MQTIIVKQLGMTDYAATLSAMQQFTDQRQNNTADQLWLTQHYPVYTQGQAGKPEHLLSTSNIALVQSDRGGQITYHGPGQVVMYFLIDIKRRQIGVRQFVNLIENSVIDLLNNVGVAAFSQADAPGVYIRQNNENYKLASLGLRVRKGCSYHGVALNVDMDLSPFDMINPCGFQGLKMTQLKNLPAFERGVNIADIENRLIAAAQKQLLNATPTA